MGPLRLAVWDPGTVDPPDLNRQILYTTEDLGFKKAEAACRRLRRVNPDATVDCYSRRIDPESFAATANDGSFVLFDCLDSFAERKGLEGIQDAQGCPIFHGGVEGWCGQAATFRREGRRYGDAFGPDWFRLPTAGKPILPQVCAAIASCQVREYLGWLEDPGSTPLDGALLLYDGKSLTTKIVRLPGGPAGGRNRNE